MIVVKTDEGYRIECSVREKVILNALVVAVRNGRNEDELDVELERMADSLKRPLCVA